MKKHKAIDLYSGIGGWTLGLKMASVDVIGSYEWWKEANRTHNINFGTKNKEINIRELKLKDLPMPGAVDFIVGSPPCTQFSFSNKGGNGDIEEGLQDIKKFLSVVEHLRPKKWVMENVPRVAKIIEGELQPKGRLKKYKKLFSNIVVVNMADYGVPQSRKRMIAGNFDAELLKEYSKNVSVATLGDVLKALNSKSIVDPVYGLRLEKDFLTDNEKESFLNDEEVRMNSESKQYHPIYNTMQFPDMLDKPARTITATCTRVSRESIVISDLRKKGNFRRLSPRERASIQTFPITYQFFGNNYSSKLKMIGNALPPLMTYYIVQCLKGIKPNEIDRPRKIKYKHKMPRIAPEKVAIDIQGRKYKWNRCFRAAIPGLRFGSGVRFDLSNSFHKKKTNWSVGFYYGTSKNIKKIDLGSEVLGDVLKVFCLKNRRVVKKILKKCEKWVKTCDSETLQKVWTHQVHGKSPYDAVDRLGGFAEEMLEIIQGENSDKINQFGCEIFKPKKNGYGKKENVFNEKLRLRMNEIMAGFIAGSIFNISINNSVSRG